ncbi:hypothetical protein SDC9_207000 [bioreactor metagenome]|uniref:Uncharacterized protein n=1 Tax=bioreactor metagenome TaxID=1076179 RepID=A0A645J988_9ZZZZ
MKRVFHIQRGHAQSGRGNVHALEIVPRAEKQGAAIRSLIGLHALENLLAVMQYGGGRVNGKRAVRQNFALVPNAVRCTHDEHVVGEYAPEAKLGFILGLRFGGGGQCNFHDALQSVKFKMQLSILCG